MPPTQIAHVALGTHRFEEMIAFYQSVFAAVVRMRNDRFAFLSFDGEHHRHALINLGPLAEGSLEGWQDYSSRVGVRHVAYTMPDVEALIATYRRLRDERIARPVKCVKHGPTLSLYYEDPDGNRFEFYADVMDASAAADYMLTDTFMDDPVGDSFDPEELCALMDSGSSYAEFVQRVDL